MTRSSRANTVLATGPASAPFDKYGDYRPDIAAARDGMGEVEGDQVRLKDAMGGGDIMKTTDIRISDEESEVEGKAW